MSHLSVATVVVVVCCRQVALNQSVQHYLVTFQLVQFQPGVSVKVLMRRGANKVTTSDT